MNLSHSFVSNKLQDCHSLTYKYHLFVGFVDKKEEENLKKEIKRILGGEWLFLLSFLLLSS